MKIDNNEDVQAIHRKIANIYSTFPSFGSIVGLSAISEAVEFKPLIDIESSLDVLKVKLVSYYDSELDEIAAKSFEEYCSARKLFCVRTPYSNELNIYRLSGITADTLEDLREFDGILSVTEMPSFSITTDELTADNNIPVKYPEKDVEYPVVGVLDTGIQRIPHLDPWLVQENITYFVEADINKAHGTFVAGIIEYGDELEGVNYTGAAGCKLFEAIVAPDPNKLTIYEDELIHNIRDAINRHRDIKTWNLSLGSDQEIALDKFSDFAFALDEIMEHQNVIICKSAGNCTNFKYGGPKGRITNAADTVRGIVVGSLAHESLTTDISPKHHPSPFSRVGPGPSHLVKPDVGHMGGNAGFDARNNVVINPVRSFSINGEIIGKAGTSFSTGRISALIAGMDQMLQESYNPLLLKALLIHSAKYPPEMQGQLAEKMRHTGFGLPSNVQDILFNELNEVTLILQDTMEKGHFIDILDFPFPGSLIDENGFFYGQITITLVTAPILEAGQGSEYCQSNIDVYFGTYDDKIDRDTNNPIIKNPVGADGRKNLLSPALYSKSAARDQESAFASERMLVSYGNKFQPVKKWAINLEDFTPANKEKFLKAPKNFFLKMEGLYRHFTEAKCERENTIPSQDFCLIISIRDTRNQDKVYNEVTQLLDYNNFIHNNIKLRQEVRVNVENKS